MLKQRNSASFALICQTMNSGISTSRSKTFTIARNCPESEDWSHACTGNHRLRSLHEGCLVPALEVLDQKVPLVTHRGTAVRPWFKPASGCLQRPETRRHPSPGRGGKMRRFFDAFSRFALACRLAFTDTTRIARPRRKDAVSPAPSSAGYSCLWRCGEFPEVWQPDPVRRFVT